MKKQVLNLRSFKSMLALNSALHLCDVASTYIFRKVPGSRMKEGNPLFKWIIHNDKWGVAIAIKVAYWAIFSRKLYKAYSQNPAQAVASISTANLLMGLVVLWNLSHVVRHLKQLNSQ